MKVVFFAFYTFGLDYLNYPFLSQLLLFQNIVSTQLFIGNLLLHVHQFLQLQKFLLSLVTLESNILRASYIAK